MEVVRTHTSVEESEMIEQLLGARCFQEYESDFDSSYYSSNWPQEDSYSGLNCGGYSGNCSLGTSNINHDINIISSKSIKRKCETESKRDARIQVPTKKACTSITNTWQESESSCLSGHDSNEKSSVPEPIGKNKRHLLYARKRRENINWRLRTLQKLIPNGTKVDISTMLEEAYQYVKFLQLQIKLLCSDELWMYAPIAFNGINNELSLDISQAPQSGIKMA